MPRIPEDILERIRDAADIVDVVSEHVQLAKKGRNFFGLCPFHEEKSPSFSVNPDRQIYYCFGCGVGGNIFKFVQEGDRVTFVEAVKFLAERTGISLPERAGPSREESDTADRLYRAASGRSARLADGGASVVLARRFDGDVGASAGGAFLGIVL